MPRVGLVGDYLAHQHHRDHLGGLGQDLRWEADELEGLILAPAAEDVGDGRVGVLVDRGHVTGLAGGAHIDAGHQEGKDAVDKDQELGVFKLLPAVGPRHDALLQGWGQGSGGVKDSSICQNNTLYNGHCV